MLIIGAKGFAKEVLEVVCQTNIEEEVAFFDDISSDIGKLIYKKYKVIKDIDAAKKYFLNTDKRFALGIGNPVLRYKMQMKFSAAGGVLVSTISPFAHIGRFDNHIEDGCNIMTGAVITNSITIKKAALINLNCTIGHDSVIGNYVELSPGVHISGNCIIDDYTTIGTNACILPKIKIGRNVIIAAGSVVTKDVADNVMLAGVPAILKKELPPLELLTSQ